MVPKVFRGALIVSVLSLAAGSLYGALTGGSASPLVAALSALWLTAILGVLEFVFSFDNAIVNAKYVAKLEHKWQQWFMTWGILIAVFGMRLLFPLAVVGLTAHMWPVEALHLAFAGGSADTPGTYAYEMVKAHPSIAAFGGLFLLNIAVDWACDEEKDFHWIGFIEAPLAKVGKLDQVSTIVSLLVLAGVSTTLPVHEAATVLFAGVLGIALYKAVSALNSVLDEKTKHDEEASAALVAAGIIVKQTGRAALMTVLFLEILDASFSFDGVIGAFAITSDPVIIMLGLGFIGAIWVRSLTVYLVRQGTLDDYVYLEHGAHWSIGVLSLVLLTTIAHPVPEWFTGLIGITFVGAAFYSSLRAKKNADDEADDAKVDSDLTAA